MNYEYNKHYINESPEKLLTFIAVPAGIVLEQVIRKRNQ